MKNSFTGFPANFAALLRSYFLKSLTKCLRFVYIQKQLLTVLKKIPRIPEIYKNSRTTSTLELIFSAAAYPES